MKLLLIAAAAAVSATAPASSEPNDGQRIFREIINVSDGARTESGRIWFAGWPAGARFVLPAGDDHASDRLWQLLMESNKESRSLNVEYDAGSAKFDPESGSLLYPLCSASIDDIVVKSPTNCESAPLSVDKASTLTKIAIGRAQAYGHSPKGAVDVLTRALADPSTPVALQIIALDGRAEANDRIAWEQGGVTEDGDRALIAALADNRRLETLDPKNVERRFSLAAELVDLGDYDAAEQVYAGILERWPDENYRVTVRRAALARLNNKNEKALEILNSLVTQVEGDLGMKFHYHRALTLMKLSRFDEAIADLNEGMRSQPDFPASFLFRACAYASIGQHAYAAGDFDHVTALLESFPSAESSNIVQREIALAKSAAERTRQAAAADRAEAITGLCDEPLAQFDTARPRSPLLGATAVAKR